MPPAFNLSQDQTLQFNPSTICQSLLRNQPLTQSNLQRNYLRVSTSNTLKASSRDRRPPHPFDRIKRTGRLPTTQPRAAPQKPRSTHTHRLFILLKSGWLRGQDLNLRPSGYEPDELPDCSTPRPIETRTCQISRGRIIATRKIPSQSIPDNGTQQEPQSSSIQSRIGCHCSISLPLRYSGKSNRLRPLNAALT